MKFVQTLHDIGDKKKYANRVLNQPSVDVVQMHLKEGEEISTHHAKVETLIIVRTGKLSFTIEEETVELTNEEILQMDPFEKHSLRALEETDMLLLKIK